MPQGTHINARDMFDLFNADIAFVEVLIWHAYCESVAVVPLPETRRGSCSLLYTKAAG